MLKHSTFTRRQFAFGAGLFGALGAFGGNRFFASSGFKAGCRPNVRFGVVSDIHITCVGAVDDPKIWGTNHTFRHTLEWFREQNVDAVLIAGDMADLGMDEHFLAIAQAWYSVFPDDRYPDGRPIEKVFVTGNHDWHGYRYDKQAEKRYPDKTERMKHVLRADMPGWWEKTFREKYEPIYLKEIKGYSFIGSHWDTDGYGTGGPVYPFGRIEGFLARHGKTIDPSRPFFYVQHPHPKDTCYGSWAWGHDKGIVTKTLSAYPNAIAFSGHSHYSLTDERSIWQGSFTSVGAGSLRYTGETAEEWQTGFENGRGGDWRASACKLMRKARTKDCRQGMLWSVYDDCIVVRRREFLSDLDLGPDWVMPLPTAESRPFAFAEHAKKMRIPEFPAGTKPVVRAVTVINRGGSSKDGKDKIAAIKKSGYEVSVPPVVADGNARLYTLEFSVKAKDGKICTKYIVPNGFNHSIKHSSAKERNTCLFAKDEIGAGDLTFSVTPLNCFRRRGRSVETVHPVSRMPKS